ncbi:MAG TPA: HIT domain-containing protein [Bryobacteraceae bacterium]|nr:HIT domain-containing protein [Bryobacteraceae bacterium]
MDYLWTPWRYNYVTTADEKTGNCIFCAAAADREHDRERLVVYRAARNFVILNRYPYTSGHLMVVPYEHVDTLTRLPDETLFELIALARRAETHLRAVYHPDGLNLGFNLGRSAGAGIAAHLHMHVLPRWAGDTSFITAVSETRVLPEDLGVTWERLRAAFLSA